jgi:hypothetical protein
MSCSSMLRAPRVALAGTSSAACSACKIACMSTLGFPHACTTSVRFLKSSLHRLQVLCKLRSRFACSSCQCWLLSHSNSSRHRYCWQQRAPSIGSYVRSSSSTALRCASCTLGNTNERSASSAATSVAITRSSERRSWLVVACSSSCKQSEASQGGPASLTKPSDDSRASSWYQPAAARLPALALAVLVAYVHKDMGTTGMLQPIQNGRLGRTASSCATSTTPAATASR